MKNLLNWFLGMFSNSAKVFFKSVFTEAKTQAIALLKDVALQAVIEAQKTGTDSAEKRKVVFNKIKEYAKAKGIDAKDSIVNLTLEMALQTLKD